MKLKLLISVAKAFASAGLSGYAASLLLSLMPFPLPFAIKAPALTFAGVSGLLWYIRVWIQCYYFDKSFPTPKSCRNLRGKTAIVTGGTVGGIGFASAKILVELGCNVIVTVRTKEKGRAACHCLSSSGGASSYVICDFLSHESILNCAAEIKTKASGIDFLVLNAGILTPTKTGSVADIWMTNHLGPWMFLQELRSHLAKASRVVWVSSGAHKEASISWANPFYPSSGKGALGGSAYGQSKLANIMHMREFQRRIRSKSPSLFVKCAAVTPGAVLTNIFRNSIPALLSPIVAFLFRSPRVGAQVVKMACLSQHLQGGEYLSNCYVKETEGVGRCSNDQSQWVRLWELTQKQAEELTQKQTGTRA